MPVETLITWSRPEPGCVSRLMDTSISVSDVLREIDACLALMTVLDRELKYLWKI
jgi:hypothetical protein